MTRSSRQDSCALFVFQHSIAAFKALFRGHYSTTFHRLQVDRVGGGTVERQQPRRGVLRTSP